MIKVTEILSNGKAGRSFTAKSPEHADRLERRILDSRPVGSSTYVRRTKI